MSKKTKNYFPIRTKTSCQLKWGWTSLYLNNGTSRTCHKTSKTTLTPENFKNFHNTETVLEDRRQMLKGNWPKENCSYCRLIEESGGMSDRLNQIDIPDMYPPELDHNPSQIIVDPVVVEVFLSNLCNLGCVYCTGKLSSTINTENKKFDVLPNISEETKKILTPVKSQYSSLLKSFWEWFPEGFPKLKRFHVLGGEPFLQKEFDTILDYIEEYPNPDCILNIVTNLSYPREKLEYFVRRFKNLISKKKIKRIDISCSIDCWGEEQEYVRYGIDLEQWKNNFEYLVKNRFLYLSVNQTISVLTIKTMPILLQKLTEWKKERAIYHTFGLVTPGPKLLIPSILPGHIWKDDFKNILSLMPYKSDDDKRSWEYMNGIANMLLDSNGDNEQTNNLVQYLDEKDRRRNTDWRKTFPWLSEHVNNVHHLTS